MIRIISIINFTVFVLLVASGFTIFSLARSSFEPPIIIPKTSSSTLPKNPFTQPEMAYQSIVDGPFSVRWHTPSMQLPDLKEEILYYGKNGRPDNSEEEQLLTITLKTTGDSKTIKAKEKVFLVYRNGFYFSQDQRPTSLWLELSSKKNEDVLAVHVGMLNENKESIQSPEEYANFELEAKEFTRSQATNWEIGGSRVDSTLLVRQRARWIGQDVFLNMHGGEEYEWTKDKQRIDFMGDTPYCCFVKEGDFLVWKKGKWLSADKQTTVGSPLLVIKKVEDKLMSCELWDIDGRSKAVLHLIRSKEATPFANISEEFKFVGAKTWAQFVIESHQERILIKPNDWLILCDGSWKKITSSHEVDDYVSQRLTGPLFILDKMIKQNGKQVLIGHLFNASRTEVTDIELPAQQNSFVSRPSLPTQGRTLPLTQEKDPPHDSSNDLSRLEDKAQKLSRGMYKNFREDPYEE